MASKHKQPEKIQPEPIAATVEIKDVLSQDQFFKLTEDQKQAFRDANGTVSNQ